MHFKIIIEYDGGNYKGWQKQDNLPTIQGTIELAIFLLTKEKVELVGSGRTDTGVHALNQVADFHLAKNFEVHKLVSGINFYLRKLCGKRNKAWKNAVDNYNYANNCNIYSNLEPFKEQDIVIRNCEIIESLEFSSRFSAKARTYRYKILDSKVPTAINNNRVWHIFEVLDENKMNKASQLLVGRKDFSSFRDSECQANSPIKTILGCKVFREDGLIIFEIKARSFLHHMVRNIMGTLILVGNNKININDFQDIIDAKNRTKSGQNAPSCGLYFCDVEY